MLNIKSDTDPRYPTWKDFNTIPEDPKETGIPASSLRWQRSTGKSLTCRSTGHTYEIRWKEQKVRSKCKVCEKWLTLYDMSKWFNVCNYGEISEVFHNLYAAPIVPQLSKCLKFEAIQRDQTDQKICI